MKNAATAQRHQRSLAGKVAAVVFGVALVFTLLPSRVRADALPPDPNDIYYHCTAAEQCPSGSKTCKAIAKGAGHRDVDSACADEATGQGLTQRCMGKDGFLYCPGGASAPPPPRSSRGCSF